MATPAAVYRPRNPQDSDYYRCVEDYFETFVQNYDEHFSRQYGFWRPYVEQVIYRYLDCGDLHNGFARVKCKDCGHTLKGTREYLLAFVLKRSGNHAKGGTSGATSAHPAIRNVWWNLGSGSAWTSSTLKGTRGRMDKNAFVYKKMPASIHGLISHR